MVAPPRHGRLSEDCPLEVYWQEPAGWGGASGPQAAFHRDPARKRFLRWPNQTGKTRAGAAEAWAHALGSHPYRDVPAAPNLGSILCADLKSGWRKLSAKMREVEPRGALHPACTYDEARGYYFRGERGLGLKNGSLIKPYGSEQPLTALASDTVDWAWVDEPPKPGHWGEFVRGLAVKMAPLWVTLTPIGRPCGWLRDIVSGNPERGETAREPDWSEHVGTLDREHCPHRSQESIDGQILSTLPEDVGQRIHADWEGFTQGRRVPGFGESNIFDDDEWDAHAENLERTGRQLEIGIGADWGEIASHTVWYLVAWDGHTLWVLAEWSPSDRMVEREEVRAFDRDVLQPWGLTWHRISVARGDSNSAGRRGIAGTVNGMITRAIAEELRLPRSPIEFTRPYKGKGSVLARSRIISAACIEQRLRVHQSCRRLQHSYRHWMGENNDLKHPFDAAGYIAEHWLSPTGRADSAGVTMIL